MNRRIKEEYIMIIISLFVLIGGVLLYQNQQEYLAKVDEQYSNGDAFCLDKNVSSNKLSRFLLNKGYLSDPKDAILISETIANQIAKKNIPNLGELNKERFLLNAELADSLGGIGLKSRVQKSLNKLGYNDDIEQLYHQRLQSSVEQHNTDGSTIEVHIDDSSSVSGILIRLKEHFYNDSIDLLGNLISANAQDSIVAYAKTNKEGKAIFRIQQGRYYSVLPIRKGYEYGRSKGTKNGAITSNNTIYKFKQKKHQISLFDSHTYSKIKQDKCLTIRTPEQYRDIYLVTLSLFLISWWAIYGLLCLYDISRKKKSEHSFIMIIMFITGIGLLTMLSIFNPLTDDVNGLKYTYGIAEGILLMFLLSCMNFEKFRSSNIFVSITPFIKKRWRWEGDFFFWLALILSAIVFFFGNGPEGSDAKVNLLGMQPSELSIFLMIIFIASAFANNILWIQKYADKNDNQEFGKNSFSLYWFWNRLRRVLSIMLAEVLILLIFIIFNSDMGPALILLVSSILLYSVARNEHTSILYGVVSFFLILIPLYQWNSTSITTTVAFVVWCILWTLYCNFKHKQLHESAIFLNIIFVIMGFGGQILSTLGISAGQRLLNRTAMIGSGIWENIVPGGDQVAQGIWGLASGGFWGQGLAQGNANLIPACHTDMIFESIGEIMGWCGLLLIIISFALIVVYGIRVAKRTANLFAFFFVTGIIIVTIVQFLIIVLGSIGIIPLTGVPVPFLSYGKSCMVVLLAFFGIIISLSRERQNASDEHTYLIIEKLKSHYQTLTLSTLGIFGILSFIIICKLSYYQWGIMARDQYLTRPVLTSNTEGSLVLENNPRITNLLNHLETGNIYDRNGVLLATSNIDTLLFAKKELLKAGIAAEHIDSLKEIKQKRYYPFGNNLLFMIGDKNTNIVGNNSELYPRGYAADFRHVADLCGFNEMKDYGKYYKLTTSQYKASPFLPEREATFTIPLKSYSDSRIIAMLKEGISNKKVIEWNKNRINRDLHLTIDGKMQLQMQKQMENDIKKNPSLNYIKKLRASVVIMNAKTGELLCSANYPLPNQDTIKAYEQYRENNINQLAYTDRDLGATYFSQPGSVAKVMSSLAAYNKFGPSIDTTKYFINKPEIVGHDKYGWITMQDALVYSSNAYFVNLVNMTNLYESLANLYWLVGSRVHVGLNNEGRHHSIIPYYFYQNEKTGDSIQYQEEIKQFGQFACNSFMEYKTSPKRSPNDYISLKKPEWGLAWGQFHIYSTPLSMARMISIVANDGQYIPTTYVKGNTPTSIQVISKESAQLIKHHLQVETEKHVKNGHKFPFGMGGKTGTPNRDFYYFENGRLGVERNINDAWYVCFVPSVKDVPLTIAVRIERVGLTKPKKNGCNSSSAVAFTERTVLPVLRNLNYIK